MVRMMMALERVGLAALVLAWAAPGLAQEAGEVERGRELALALCANCHLNAGQGEKAGATGIPGFRAVANRPNQSREDVVRWLKSVPTMMPNHHLTQDEMQALSAFVMSLRVVP
jgi:mono/diheme cytochrome c family protein